MKPVAARNSQSTLRDERQRSIDQIGKRHDPVLAELVTESRHLRCGAGRGDGGDRLGSLQPLQALGQERRPGATEPVGAGALGAVLPVQFGREPSSLETARGGTNARSRHLRDFQPRQGFRSATIALQTGKHHLVTGDEFLRLLPIICRRDGAGLSSAMPRSRSAP
jgi:hypothetical protein